MNNKQMPKILVVIKMQERIGTSSELLNRHALSTNKVVYKVSSTFTLFIELLIYLTTNCIMNFRILESESNLYKVVKYNENIICIVCLVCI